jgi:plasmid maintenance system antidote protein VapI
MASSVNGEWLVQQVNEPGLKELAERLEYDAANLSKVVAGKRMIARELRKRISECIIVEQNTWLSFSTTVPSAKLWWRNAAIV